MEAPVPSSPRSLFDALAAYQGDAVVADLLVPWADASRAQLARELAPVAHPYARQPPAREWRSNQSLVELDWTLYALSRVIDVLLLGHQPVARSDGVVAADEFARASDRVPFFISSSDLADFVGRLGIRLEEPLAFHPVFHEIVELIEDDACRRPAVERLHWPCLRVNELVLQRAGVTLRCARSFARRPWADSSTLYWAFRRRYRSTSDLSLGWGHNSEWRTRFRRDYATPDRIVYNAGGSTPVDGPDPRDEPPDPVPLPASLRRQLLMHRCFLPEPPADADPMPYSWTLTERAP